MNRSDRRLSRRLHFGEEDLVYLDFRVGRRSLRAKVVDLTKDALRVRLAASAGDVGWGSVPEVGDARLSFGDVPFRSIGRLEVMGCAADADGVELRLHAPHEGSRASLWLALDDLSAGEAGAMGGSLSTLGELPKLPARGVYTEDARLERLEFIERSTGSQLDELRGIGLSARKLTGNIENLLSSVEVPVGVAGPLLFRGQSARGLVYAPLATTEGALVASATRGATALSRSGGVTTRVVAQRMMRVPLFVLADMHGAMLFVAWIRDHVEEIREQTRQVSRYARLVSVEPTILGNMVHLHFLYETGDAAGQNMTTTCTWQACQWLMKQMRHFNEIRFENFIIEANMSGDKKVNFQSFIDGRGTRVTAEAYLSRDAIERTLKVTPEQLIRSNQGFLAGSVQVGMVGYNINIANIIAAMFTATGQDIACVHESSIGYLHVVPADDGVYASLLLPSLIVGTVGGGTGLPRQNAFLEMLHCAGPGKMGRLAEIIAGYCLALDLSTLSAIAGGQFAAAHEKLGRNRPVAWFQRQDLNARFFTRMLRGATGDPELEVTDARFQADVTLGSSILTELTARKVQKLVGLLPYRLGVRPSKGMDHPLDVLVKCKPLDDEVILMVHSMAANCGPRLAAAHNRFKDRTGFKGCHARELAVYRQEDARFTRHAPRVYGVHEDPEREAYVVVLERLEGMLLLDTADDVSGWDQAAIEAALRGIAQVHSLWYGREEELKQQPWLGEVMTAETMVEGRELWEALGVHAREEFPEWFTPEQLSTQRRLARGLKDWWARAEQLPRTLIHNDFNPRNICLRPTPAGPILCAYDWELATLGLPQHDVCELLCFVLGPDATQAEIEHYLDVHRLELQAAAGVPVPRAVAHEAWWLSLKDLAMNRLGMYVMAHTFRHYDFMERVIATTRRFFELGGPR
jgi:hydroxymethylglutaryl-CoA reductase (NADPH)